MNGIIISAPSSGAGKTVITLALLRALSRRGVRISSFKVGPDYIDPQFHTLASGRSCFNIDLWAMRPSTVVNLLSEHSESFSITLVEGVMGLFDGAQNGHGSTADVAAWTGFPVVLIADVKGQSESAAAVIQGFANYREDTHISAVIFNRVGSSRHRDMLERAIEPLGIPVLGYLPRTNAFALPARHLGLVQAQEHVGIETLLENAANVIDEHIDLELFQTFAHPFEPKEASSYTTPLSPIGQRIAVANDSVFSFIYPHVIEGWRSKGVEIFPFSPINDEPPREGVDAIFLPGGYPEIHAGELATKFNFFDGLRKAKNDDATIYGECGGFMTLGHTLIDRDGEAHKMAGLLPVTTSFAKPKLHLGYRSILTNEITPFGNAGTALRGHEFHYSQECDADGNANLFSVRDAGGNRLPTNGLKIGQVMGSYIHLIDRAED